SLFYSFIHATGTTATYLLSLHDALPIWKLPFGLKRVWMRVRERMTSMPSFSVCTPLVQVRLSTSWTRSSSRSWRLRLFPPKVPEDRKSTRLNSSHDQISYAVFCLKKKKT